MSFIDTLGTTIVKGVSDAFSPISLVTGALSFLGGERRNQQQADSVAVANAFSAQQFATRYQTTVKDMEAAGLNPMLAYQQGASGQPSGQMAQYQDTISPAVASFQNQNLYESQAESNWSSAAQSRANVKLINETVNKTKSEIQNLSSMNDQILATVDNLVAQHQNLIDDNANIKTQNSVLKATASKILRETQFINSQEDLVNAQEALNKLEQKLKTGDVEAMKQFNNLGRNYKEVAPIIDLLKNLIRR